MKTYKQQQETRRQETKNAIDE
jgi:chromosome segregation ATPase